MKVLKTGIFLLFVAIMNSTVFSQQLDTVKQQPYQLKIKKQRQQKDKQFATTEHSPLTAGQQVAFESLDYFPVDKTYKIKAQIEKSEDTTSFVIPTTTNRKPLYRKYGIAHFTLKGKKRSLVIYRSVSLMKKEKYKDYLFIPFTDLTNGVSTYGGGRYLDARISGGDSLVIDFNKAYNPYCAYNGQYSCPIPPAENHLNLKINAGEKAFDH